MKMHAARLVFCVYGAILSICLYEKKHVKAILAARPIRSDDSRQIQDARRYLKSQSAPRVLEHAQHGAHFSPGKGNKLAEQKADLRKLPRL